jgi:hypothetical protein
MIRRVYTQIIYHINSVFTFITLPFHVVAWGHHTENSTVLPPTRWSITEPQPHAMSGHTVDRTPLDRLRYRVQFRISQSDEQPGKFVGAGLAVLHH